MKAVETAGYHRRCVAVIAALVLAASATGSWAQAYPAKPVRIVVPSSAGGPIDITARGMSVPLSPLLGQPIIIDNRVGANGVVGTNVVAKADPDGYTMLMATASHTANPSLVKDLPYDTLNDFIGITEFARTYGLVLITGPGFPAKTLEDIIAAAKKPGARLTYATSGVGNPTHIAGAWFGKLAGLDLQDVQYKGSSASNVQDLMTGRVDLAFLALVNSAPLIQAGKVRGFALTGSRRSQLIPDVPSFPELGYKEMDLPGVYGLYFPAKTPRERVMRMHQEVMKAIKGPEMTKLLADSGMYATGTTPEEFAVYLKADIQRQAQLMKTLGIAPQ
jgi:tripartite-type tricarboxylate transporter receptor subunit TctC